MAGRGYLLRSRIEVRKEQCRELSASASEIELGVRVSAWLPALEAGRPRVQGRDLATA